MNKNKEMKLKQRVMQLAQQKKYPEARDVALSLVQVLPKDIEVWFALAQLQERLGEFESAVRSYYQVCQGPSPRYEMALEKAVLLCWEHKFISLGVSPARALIKLKPNSSQAYFYLGFFWFEARHYLAAEPYLVKAAEMAPDDALLQLYCGQLYTFIAQPEKAIVYYKRCQKLNPDDNHAFVSSILTHNYTCEISDEQIFQVHKEFAKKIELGCLSDEGESGVYSSRPDRLKVAYISADFRAHSVAYFFKAMIESYSKDKYELVCYSDVETPDSVTEYFKSLSGCWLDSHKMTDEELYQQVRADGVDILVDLAGYAGSIRLGVFARRAASVQVTYLGYPNTTGLLAMDYRITDELSDPEGQTEAFHTEVLKRLPGGFLCFTPADNSPDVSPLPALKAGGGGVCFGSFNSFSKLSMRLLNLWVKVLLAVPNSTLYVKSKPLAEEALREWVWRTFEEKGVDRARVTLKGWESEVSSHLEQYSKVDIHLDSYPYNGTTTICESLWQGVPVISLVGLSHRSRVGLSILSQVGLDSYVAHNEQEYVNIAIDKAANVGELCGLREGLREKMRSSSLLDRSRFIGELEAVYEQMWVEKNLN